MLRPGLSISEALDLFEELPSDPEYVSGDGYDDDDYAVRLSNRTFSTCT